MSQGINVLFAMDVREDIRIFIEQRLAHREDINLEFPTDLSEDNLFKLTPEAEVIIGWKMSKELLLSAEKLKVIINPWAGVQHTIGLVRDVNEIRPVTFLNAHDNAYATAQHAVALLLALMNRVVDHHNWMVEGRWRMEDTDAPSRTLRGRRIGLLGYGHVNSQVHRFLSPFELEFSALRRDWSKERARPPTPFKRYTSGQLHEFLESIDILIIALPQTDETAGLIGEEELALLGKESFLLNIARGRVVEQEALYTALKERTIAGAAIDVWYTYKPEPDPGGRKYPYELPFHELDNVVLSPHRAASPYEAPERWLETIENLERLADGRDDLLNVVDLDAGY